MHGLFRYLLRVKPPVVLDINHIISFHMAAQIARMKMLLEQRRQPTADNSNYIWVINNFIAY